MSVQKQCRLIYTVPVFYPFGLCGFQTHSLAVSKGHKLHVLEKKVKNKVSKQFVIQYSGELCGL
jgi:hypothetical protein